MKKVYIAIALSVLPFLGLLYFIPQDGALSNIANVAGFVGAVLIWWQVALGVRPAARALDANSHTRFIALHKRLGVYGFGLILLHPILEMFAYRADFYFLFEPSFADTFATHITFGRIAFIVLIAVWLSSHFARKYFNFKWWKYVHFLSYIIAGLVFAHVYTIGTYFENYLWVKILWWFFTYSFYAMLLWRLVDLFIGRATYTLAKREQLAENTYQYTLVPAKHKKLTPRAGQYAYLSLSRVSAPHPFTVMDFDHATGMLIFGIKTFGAFTDALSQLPEGASIFVEGPYGSFTKEARSAKATVFIAGGIGITPFIKSIEHYGNKQTYLFNCNRTLDNAVKRDVLREKLAERYVDVLSDTQDIPTGAEKGQLTREILEKRLPDEFFADALFFLCGPPGFMKAASEILHETGVAPERIFTEEFGF